MSLLLALAYVAVAALLVASMWRHEMWRDELQAWMIARDSTSLGDLFGHNMRYEGHPGLWHLALFVLTRVTDNPVAMQALHWPSAEFR